MSAQKILFITLSNVGDAVLTTPTLEALHQSYPNAKVDIVCDKRSAELFEYCPYLHRIFIKEKNAGLVPNLKLILALRIRYYDIAVDLRTDILLKLIRAQRKLYKLPNHLTLSMHSAVKHFSAIREASNVPIPATKLWSSVTIDQKIHSIMLPLKGKNILALGLGANFSGKIWPVACYIALSDALAPYFDAVLLLGNTQEQLFSQQFIAQSQLPTYDFCGKLTLVETYVALKQATYFVGNDSGLGHIASAAAIPTFTIFGPGSPARYLPWSKKARYYQASSQTITQIDANTIAGLIVDDLSAIKPA